MGKNTKTEFVCTLRPPAECEHWDYQDIDYIRCTGRRIDEKVFGCKYREERVIRRLGTDCRPDSKALFAPLGGGDVLSDAVYKKLYEDSNRPFPWKHLSEPTTSKKVVIKDNSQHPYPKNVREWYAFYGGEESGISLEQASKIWDAASRIHKCVSCNSDGSVTLCKKCYDAFLEYGGSAI